MPIPWLTVLKAVPWTEVISNAPKIAGGAKKLWDSVSHKPGDPGSLPDPAPEATPAAIQAGMQAELARQQAAIAELQQQMRASSELLASLAEQNGQLIARVDENRRRLRLTLFAVALLTLSAVGWLVLAGLN